MLGGLLSVGAKLAGKALRWASKGKLLGSGGGRQILRTAGRIATGGATAVVTAQAVRPAIDLARRTVQRYTGGQVNGSGRAPGYSVDAEGQYHYRKPYRRMNYANGRALNRAIRRLGGAEKIFRKIFTFNHGKAPHQVRPRHSRKRA